MVLRTAAVTKLMKWANQDDDARPLSYKELQQVVRDYDALRADYNDLLREKQFAARPIEDRTYYCDPNDPNKPTLSVEA